YWPPERNLVERGYGTLEFPFAEERAPVFRLEKRWNLAAMIGYLKTWSAAQRYEAALGQDPLALIEDELSQAWGPPEKVRTFRWDLDLRVGRKR
ncbi:MAG TPA: SAM-dependent methyltransferase, partial [Thermoanaerobaculia bacterium]|nr:SAM-dependent methyltransferase [Thermoanaerobaculia bacterium]